MAEQNNEAPSAIDFCPPRKTLKRKPRISYPHVACPHCARMICPGGMRTHQRSLSCLARQSRNTIPKDYVLMQYDSRSMIYALTNKWLDFTGMKNIQNFVVGYRRPGWGKNGRNLNSFYMHHRLETILTSPNISNDEKLISLYRDVDSPEFIAAYTMAELVR